jgi:hypothetical protein
MQVRVLAARPGLRVPITDAKCHPLRSAQGAISVTDEGLLYEHSGQVVKGPVLVDDSLYLRDQVAVGDLVIVADQPAHETQPVRARARREE